MGKDGETFDTSSGCSKDSNIAYGGKCECAGDSVGSGVKVESVHKSPDRCLPWRVFINHIDSYHGSKLMDLLWGREYVPAASSRSSLGSGGAEHEQHPTDDDDDEDEDGEEASSSEARDEEAEPRKFELVGTAQRTESALEDVVILPPPENDRQSFMAELWKCGFIIYDITQDDAQCEEAEWALDELAQRLESERRARPREFGQPGPIHRFVLISSVSTWARSRPSSRGEPLTESDYRKRRAHEAAKRKLECERAVLSRSSPKRHAELCRRLRALVLCAGLTYGEEEQLLEPLFKLAWLNERQLPVVEPGDNLVPLLHVRDLAASVYAIMNEWPTIRYVVAVEKEVASQKSIVKAISRTLSTGEMRFTSAEEAVLRTEFAEAVLDALTLNINISPVHLINNGKMKWQSERCFCKNIEAIVDEYRISRNLLPVRVIILGAPASGKTTLAKALCKHYKLHHITVKNLIAETITQLDEEIQNMNVMKEDENEEDGQSDEDDYYGNSFDARNRAESAQALLDELRGNLKENNGQLTDGTLTKIFRRRLLSRECQNQGYVMDGYPETLSQAGLLFNSIESESDVEDYEGEDSVTDRSPNKLESLEPEFVIVLDASDDFLMERVISLPERDLHDSRRVEEQMLQRLKDYRERNNEDVTPLQVFDELEVHPNIINIEGDTFPEMTKTFELCLRVIGEPRNYGPTLEEVEEQKRQMEAKSVIEAARAKAEHEQEIIKRIHEREKRALEWMELLDKLKQEEEEQLCLMAEPLRHYLARIVLPTLTQGLVAVAKLRPDEPIDYLAEYFLKKNPEGKIFEPDANEKINAMLESIHRLQCNGSLPPTAKKDAFEHVNIAEQSSTSDTIECCYCSSSSGSSDEIAKNISNEDSSKDSCKQNKSDL